MVPKHVPLCGVGAMKHSLVCSRTSDLAVVCPGAAPSLQVPRAEVAAQREGSAASPGWTLPAGHLTETGSQRTVHRHGGWVAAGPGPHQVAGAAAAWLHDAEQAAAVLSPADDDMTVEQSGSSRAWQRPTGCAASPMM